MRPQSRSASSIHATIQMPKNTKWSPRTQMNIRNGQTLFETLVGHACRTLRGDTVAGRHPCASKSEASSLQNERFNTSSEIVTRHVSQTSVSSSQRRASSLQNEHFVRDVLKKYPQVKREALLKRTHKQPCQQLGIPGPLKTPIPMAWRHLPPPNVPTSQFPAPATKIKLQLPHLQQAQSAAPTTKSYYSTSHLLVFSKSCTTPHTMPHIWDDFDT